MSRPSDLSWSQTTSRGFHDPAVVPPHLGDSGSIARARSRAPWWHLQNQLQALHPVLSARPRYILDDLITEALYGTEGTVRQQAAKSKHSFCPRPDSKNGGNAGEASIGCLPFTDIVEILQATIDFDRRDMQDSVYALLSSFKGRIPARLKPNHDKSINEVLQGVINQLSKREGRYE